MQLIGNHWKSRLHVQSTLTVLPSLQVEQLLPLRLILGKFSWPRFGGLHFLHLSQISWEQNQTANVQAITHTCSGVSLLSYKGAMNQYPYWSFTFITTSLFTWNYAMSSFIHCSSVAGFVVQSQDLSITIREKNHKMKWSFVITAAKMHTEWDFKGLHGFCCHNICNLSHWVGPEWDPFSAQQSNAQEPWQQKTALFNAWSDHALI